MAIQPLILGRIKTADLWRRPALEDAETLAVSMVRNGQVTGSTSIQDYMDENGLTEADLET